MAGVRHYKDLDVWRLAKELERGVTAFLKSRPAADDRDFCRDFRRSARSAPRNIAEGFGRFYPGEMLRYTRNALGSLRESQDHLDAALEERYLSAEEHKRLMQLAERAIGAGVNLSKYLQKRSNKESHEPLPRQNASPERVSRSLMPAKYPAIEPERGTLNPEP